MSVVLILKCYAATGAIKLGSASERTDKQKIILKAWSLCKAVIADESLCLERAKLEHVTGDSHDLFTQCTEIMDRFMEQM